MRAAYLVTAGLLGLACAGERGPDASTETTDQAEGAPAPVLIGTRNYDSLFDVAETLHYAAEYDAAMALLESVLETARAEAVVGAEARALARIGTTSYRTGDWERARRVSEAALVIQNRFELTDQLFRPNNTLGLINWNQNRLSEAAQYFTRAIRYGAAGGDDRAMYAATGNLGLVHTDLGNFVDARESFRTALTGLRAVGDHRFVTNQLINLGMLENRTGHPAAAVPLLDSARALADSIDYPLGVQFAVGHLGHTYLALGEPQRAFTLLDSALALARQNGARQDEASNLEIMAELARGAGDYRRALNFYRQARTINDELGGLDFETGEDLRGEATILITLGEPAQALDRAREAMRLHDKIGARLEALWDRLILADITDRLGDRSAADAYLSHAAELADSLDVRAARNYVLLAIADIAYRRGEPVNVRTIIEPHLEELVRGDFETEWRAYHYLARSYARTGDLQAAAEHGRRALDAVERVRRKFGSSVVRAMFTAERADVYADHTATLLRLGDRKGAFEVADAARGRALLEQLTAATPTTERRAVGVLAAGETLLRQVDPILESIDNLEAWYPPKERTPEQHAEVDRLYNRLDRLRTEYEEFLVRAAEVSPRDLALLGGAKGSLETVQEALEPNQLLLEYLVGSDDRLLIFAVDRSSVRVYESSIAPENLVSRVRLARELVSDFTAEPSRARRVLEGLHDVLLGPVARDGALSNVDELIVVPHHAITYVPFAALRDAQTGRYLVEDHSIRFLPSAAVLPLLEGAQREAGSGAVHAFAPFPDELPASRSEVRSTRVSGQRPVVSIGARATEQSVRTALSSGHTVHLATHGILNARNPMFSRVALARNGGGPADDGRLDVHELLSLDVRSPLVFLSGCDTGVGNSWSTSYAIGEDYSTLAQAFLFAGAQNVIATLWAIEDQGAGEFAGHFYDALGATSPVQAVAAAQRAMLADDRFSAPYYWAGYQLAGSGGWSAGAQ